MHSWGFALREGVFAETKEGTNSACGACKKGPPAKASLNAREFPKADPRSLNVTNSACGAKAPSSPVFPAFPDAVCRASTAAGEHRLSSPLACC